MTALLGGLVPAVLIIVMILQYRSTVLNFIKNDTVLFIIFCAEVSAMLLITGFKFWVCKFTENSMLYNDFIKF